MLARGVCLSAADALAPTRFFFRLLWLICFPCLWQRALCVRLLCHAAAPRVVVALSLVLASCFARALSTLLRRAPRAMAALSLVIASCFARAPMTARRRSVRRGCCILLEAACFARSPAALRRRAPRTVAALSLVIASCFARALTTPPPPFRAPWLVYAASGCVLCTCASSPWLQTMPWKLERRHYNRQVGSAPFMRFGFAGPFHALLLDYARHCASTTRGLGASVGFAPAPMASPLCR